MPKPKTPFKCLYDNDTTNVRYLTKDGPNDERDCYFTDDLITASIDETVGTGVDVHKMSPGHGWAAWWKSTSSPAQGHYQWLQSQFGAEPDCYGRYMLAGGDMVATFVSRCREVGQSPFMSLRMNQVTGGQYSRNSRQSRCSRLLYEHPEYLLAESGVSGYESNLANWMVPAVRTHFLNFCSELCAYDIDGLELDFMRYPCLFRQDQTTADQRIKVMTEFVGAVREALDRHARAGQQRRLCIKAPCHLAPYPMIGLDLERLADAGMDMLNLSPSFYTQQQIDLRTIRALLPDSVSVYLEMADLIDGHDCSKVAQRLTTDEIFFTAAHLAYSRGAQGVSLFNFVYYRNRANRKLPFHVLKHLHDPDWLARQPQHYFLCHGYGGYVPGNPAGRMMPGARARPASPFPCFLRGETPVSVALDMAPPAGGWRGMGKCRVQALHSFADRAVTMRLNGKALTPTPDTEDPYSHGYSPDAVLSLNDHDCNPDYRAWTVPAEMLVDGENRFEITMTEGEPAELFYLDVVLK